MDKDISEELDSSPLDNRPLKASDSQSVSEQDRRFSLLAIDEASKSISEDSRPHPKVGAVIVKDGNVLSRAHRGEKPKSHAEYVALDDKLAGDLVAGATVYTTLEPCTTRRHPKIACAQRLIDRKIRRVVIGMLDPNPEIRGLGDQQLSDAGIEVQLFPRDLRAQVEELNRDFIRAQKKRQMTIVPAIVAGDPEEFLAQRKRAPETKLLERIRSKPHWRIWIRPTEFRKARFQNLEQCRQFVASAEVRIQGWFSYPWSSSQTIDMGDDWISGEMHHVENNLRRAERWLLFRSGQFVYYKSFDEITQLGDRAHVLEIVDMATGTFEFASRMADRGALGPDAAISFELRGVDGRSITWPQDIWGDVDAVARNCWCQDEIVSVQRRVATAELRTRKRPLATEVSSEICNKFGWTEVSSEQLDHAQIKRFGSS